jgi:formate transporter
MNQSPFDSLLPPQMAEKAAEVGVGKATKEPLKAILLAVTGGVHIGIAFVFYTTVTTGTGDMAWGMARLAGGAGLQPGPDPGGHHGQRVVHQFRPDSRGQGQRKDQLVEPV